MQISFFEKGVQQKVPGKTITVTEALEVIKEGFYQTKIDNYRELLFSQPDRAKDLKLKLPNVTFSGSFHTLDTTKPLNERLISPSGFIVIDFDNVVEPDIDGGHFLSLQLQKDKLAESPYAGAIFISPSGTGLKVLCQYTGEHIDAFEMLENHFQQRYNYTADKSGKDITRRCFLSSDPDIYISNGASILNALPQLKPAKAAKQTAPASAEVKKDILLARELAQKLVDGKIDITANYEDWQNVGLALAFFGEDGREIFHLVSSVYSGYDPAAADKKFDNFLKTGRMTSAAPFFSRCKEAGIYGKQPPKEKPAAKQADNSLNEFFTSISIPYTEKCILGDPDDELSSAMWKGNFWLKVRNYDKKTGICETKYIFKYVPFRKFLQDAGFLQLINELKGKGNTYEFIRIHHNIIKSVNEDEIRELVDKWLRDNDLTEVEEALTRGAKTYFGNDKLKKIPAERIRFKRDTKDAIYCYFNNCFVSITPKEIAQHPYTELDGFIWLSQVKEHEFTYQQPDDNEDCVFDQFLQLAVNSKLHRVKDNTQDDGYRYQWNDEQVNKYKSVCSGIGYILHGYKDPTKTKVFGKFDGTIIKDRKSEGRSGKSLTDMAIGHVIPTVQVDGKLINKQDSDISKYLSGVSHDTRYIYFDDVPYNFNFELLFPMTTGDLTIKRLYLDPITLKHDVSPKLGINSNFTLKGEGGSFRARQFNVEYSNFFNENNTPADYFKHRFFDDWNEQQWNSFYSCMFDYAQAYLINDLSAFPAMNYHLRKLMAEIPDPYFTQFFLEEYIVASEGIADKIYFKDGKEYPLKTLYQAYKLYSPDFADTKQNSFTRWLNKCADYYGFEVNPNQGGGRHRIDGVDYITLRLKETK